MGLTELERGCVCLDVKLCVCFLCVKRYLQFHYKRDSTLCACQCHTNELADCEVELQDFGLVPVLQAGQQPKHSTLPKLIRLVLG